MAIKTFINTKEDKKMKVSYECSELIEELKQDIAEFGNDMELYVITEQVSGVTIYKDYDFEKPQIKDPESVQKISAADLLKKYEYQNRII